jgi:N-acetylmuramoyl-L-alanine amidase
VLKQTHAPSVLVELGYLSHLEDEKLLNTPQWQKQAATSIAAAVDAYFTKRTVSTP